MSATSHSQEFAQHEIDRLREELRKKTAEVVATRDDARQKMQEFAREFRVPLATVLGFSDILSACDRTHTTEWTQIAIAGHQLMELIKNAERSSTLNASDNAEAAKPGITTQAPVSQTVLHIEDNETNFRLTERILDDRPNINLLWAPTGAKGLESAVNTPPALILLDLNLPDAHGSEILTKLRANPVTEKIPVIILSADASPTRIERMLQAGARDYLTKPFEIERFLCLVDDVLRDPTNSVA